MVSYDGRVLLGIAFLVIMGAGSGVLAIAAEAEVCPAVTEQVRSEQVYAPGLPDCRAYEQASVNKNGVDANGEVNAVQASPSGDAVSFFSMAPFANALGAKSGVAQIQLSLRSPGGSAWATESLMPPNSSRIESLLVGWTKDLARTIVVSGEPVLAEGGVAGPSIENAYVRDNATNAYRLLAPNIEKPLRFVDASRDYSRILFELNENLATTNVPPASGFNNLYEWNEAKPVGERVSLAGVLPGGTAPEEGSIGGPLQNPKGQRGFYTQNTISEDGSRVFFTDVKTGFVYMREPEVGKTFQLSVGSAAWQASTSDGGFIFYIEGSELYRFNVKRFINLFKEKKEPEATSLVQAREQLTIGAEDVAGTLGFSSDGAYAYFVAAGVLATNKREHENSNKEMVVEKAENGKNNLYEWHEGTVVFIAQDTQPTDWSARYDAESNPGPSGGERSSRVTPDGRALLFSESNGFDLYRAGSPVSVHNPVCVTCNPSGVPASSPAELSAPQVSLIARPNTGGFNAFVTRNLSDDGGRVFFETEEALLPEDVNSVRDVYEWEREGEGSCTSASVSFSARSGGCLYLISTGRSVSESYFGDASADGGGVFFFTAQSLVAQDQDANVDVYDSRVGGGIPAQNIVPPAPCLEEDTCRGVVGSSPVLGAPASTSLSGSGNLAAPSSASTTVVKRGTVKCPRGRKLRRGKCVKAKAKGGTKRRARKAGYERRGR
ncbi:MAG TPA: hypothetical protein VNY27_01580 [Solirubrobacteraceae bacterium]|nr:hypothetical protein [Solirubrobacteraceae bacterium]